ncbi:putative glycosyl transferase, family 14 [Rosa chinensis]|uniref:Putative glycosyl transferase, family 14 n=1 Tax=Rosa chinensis TaxID=74649 RepID=A0A2P6QEQ6_ROSCH|nr:glycosyltransferase BC10 [Rosa chinensis]PRQ32665.1 putative glycosyl transferase, family 14 [Rosa chinensis]
MFSTPFVLSFALLLSIPLLFLLAPHFLPPNNQIPIPAADEIDDQALFSRAVRSKSAFTHLSLGSKTKPKIAFLFLTNSDLHFAPLWQRFFSKTAPNLYNIYVHADPSVNVTIPPGVFRDRFIASKRTYRASPTLISATRRLLATAALDDPANIFFAVLSQYCVPLHSFPYVYHSLFASATFDKSRPATESDAELTRMGLKVRYKSFIEILSKSTSLWKRYAARGRYAMMPEVPFDQFRVGSQFFLLTRRHALVVLKDQQLWQKFKLPCYREDECYPEEHYFPTLLSMADPDGCTHYTLTRVNWTGTVNGHPYTYRPGEVSAQLIYQLRQSNFSESYLFARKFSPDCLKPLLGLSEKVIFRD